MAKIGIGEAVAASMQEIINSDDYKRMFNIVTAAKACCDCTETCNKNCSCDGKCDKSCPCHKDHGATADCGACGDGMSMASVVESMIRLSEEQDKLGLYDSSMKTIQALQSMISEAVNNDDKNDVELMPFLNSEPEIKELEHLAEEEIDDPNQAEWWLNEGRRKSEDRVSDEAINRMLDAGGVKEILNHGIDTVKPGKDDMSLLHPPLLNDTFMDMEGSSFEDDDILDFGVPSEEKAIQLDWANPKPAADEEEKFRQRHENYGHDFQPGGWELPEEFRKIEAFEELDKWLQTNAEQDLSMEDLLNQELEDSDSGFTYGPANKEQPDYEFIRKRHDPFISVDTPHQVRLPGKEHGGRWVDFEDLSLEDKLDQEMGAGLHEQLDIDPDELSWEDANPEKWDEFEDDYHISSEWGRPGADYDDVDDLDSMLADDQDDEDFEDE